MSWKKSKISSSKLVLFAENTIKGKEAVLKAWAAKVESKEVTQKLYNSKQRLLSISKSLAEALKLESGEYVKIVAEINGKEFPIFTKVGELEEDSQTFPVLVRSGTYNYLGLAPKDYVIISKDISNALIYVKSRAGYYISIRFTSTIDSGFIKAKLGSNSSIGVLKYKKILKLDETKGLKVHLL